MRCGEWKVGGNQYNDFSCFQGVVLSFGSGVPTGISSVAVSDFINVVSISLKYGSLIVYRVDRRIVTESTFCDVSLIF